MPSSIICTRSKVFIKLALKNCCANGRSASGHCVAEMLTLKSTIRSSLVYAASGARTEGYRWVKSMSSMGRHPCGMETVMPSLTLVFTSLGRSAAKQAIAINISNLGAALLIFSIARRRQSIIKFAAKLIKTHMLRTHTCGELRLSDVNKQITLAGWVQRTRDKGSILWIDLRDRYGITQLFFEEGKTDAQLFTAARGLGREFVIQAEGLVVERLSKNDKMPTGEVELKVTKLNILNPAKLPPFTIEDETDGGDDLRMKYRYLDLRRNPVREKLQLRHKMAQQTRTYLDSQNFIEVETPVLIKSTPEGARDFVVPSRIHNGEFYALPQSPQTFKQLLMVSGFDRYYQIVKCFRDEDLRADRQPEFTQIDCEMAFITQEDILNTFEGLVRHLFKNVKGIDMPSVPRMFYNDAMKLYGSDKPDTRFDMKFVELTEVAKGKNFPVFDAAELVVGINATGCSEYTRKQI